MEFTNQDRPRYTTRTLPPYRHLPFQNAHPFMDKDGHSYGEELTAPTSFGPENWQDCADYLYSIDLFNHGFWWDAHERLKQVSIAAGRESECGLFVQGLIQISAALLKYSMEEHVPAEALATMGLANVSAATGLYLGVDIDALEVSVRAYLDGSINSPCIDLVRISSKGH